MLCKLVSNPPFIGSIFDVSYGDTHGSFLAGIRSDIVVQMGSPAEDGFFTFKWFWSLVIGRIELIQLIRINSIT